MRQADIYRKEVLAGTLTEDGGEYRFCYDEAYLAQKDAQPVSLTLPLQEKVVLRLIDNFQKALPKWLALIRISFLDDEMKKAYENIVVSRLARLQK